MTTAETALLEGAIHDRNHELEVDATWAAAHLGAFRLVDVREPHELGGPLGRVPEAENIPLLQLFGRSDLDAAQPLVLVCRSGRRSALAARELASRGFRAVASVEGGMLAWNAQVWGKTGIAGDERRVNAKNLVEAITRVNGVPEVDAGWVQGNIGRFTLVDVREPHELRANGAVAQAVNVPLSAFLQQAAEGHWDKDAPLVVMCQSGGRSGRVTMALVSAGFTHVASMEGGMFGWRARGLPVG